MHFVYPLPWWLAALIVAAIAGLTYGEYRRPLSPIGPRQRAVLSLCRALVLGLLALFMCRPVMDTASPRRVGGAIVPVLVDRSRSMRIVDADGLSRLERAMSIMKGQLVPSLSARFAPEVYTIGDRLEAAGGEPVRADSTTSDLSGALRAVLERYRGQQVAGIVLLSDGADTTQPSTQWSPAAMSGESTDHLAQGPPVFAIGIGSPDRLRDREVTAVEVGDQRLDESSVDLRVSAVSFGFGRAPFDLRLVAEGRTVDIRRVTPIADGVPIEEVFTVAPPSSVPTTYTAEIAVDRAESTPENNTRRVLVNPAERQRRVLIVEGAPGFEHSFIRRAWARDPALLVDAVGRKGKSAEGQDTFFVQAGGDRAAALMRGFPERREDLYAYDAIALADVDASLLTRAQWTMIADFVEERGGGLLVTGGRSFSEHGLGGTPLEDVLPVAVSDRKSASLTAAAAGAGGPNKLTLTDEGARHPVMRIGDTLEDTRRLWSALPAMASTAPLGGARPGAMVLAVASAPTGIVYPVVAVQRFGRGRAMMFSGEASWRWRMLLPSADRTFELFWRQAARWIAATSPDPISISILGAAAPGEDIVVDVEVRDQVFVPVGDAVVDGTVTAPNGAMQTLKLRRSATAGGYGAALRADEAGVYRVDVAARRGTASLGKAVLWLDVGGNDREFADPRLNEPWLRRVARATGGRYLRPVDARKIVDWIEDTALTGGIPTRRDLWHEPWAFILIVSLLTAEWSLRRRWGLR